MIRDYVLDQKRQLDSALNAFLREALFSWIRTGGVAAVTVLAALLTLNYAANAKRPIGAVVATGALATLAGGLTTKLSASDAVSDWQTWAIANSGEKRAALLHNGLNAQMDAYQQSQLFWLGNAQAANAWRQQQWQQQRSAASVEAAPVATVPALPVPASPSPRSYDLAQDLGQHPQSAAIIGVPGAGKGMLVSNAIRHLKSRYPNVSIMVLDPKDDPKERGYWEGFGATVCRFSFLGKDPDACAEWYLNRLEQFANMPAPKLLIGDEGTALIATLENASPKLRAVGRHKAFISHLASMGDSGETWFWLMAQSANLRDLGISGGVRSIFRAIALVSPKNRNAVEALLSTDFVPLPEGGKDEVYRLMEQSPVNRAFYDGKSDRWLPSPKLQNWSGYDRDSRQALPGFSVPIPPPKNEDALTLERIWENSPSMEERPESKLTKLMDYLGKNGPVQRRTILRNWAGNHGVSARGLDDMLDALTLSGVVVVSLKGYEIADIQ